MHKFLDLGLFLSIFSQLLLDEARELLLFSNLHVSIEAVQAPFHFNLVHVSVENLPITDHKVAHEHPLAKLLAASGSVDESQAGLSGHR